MSEKIFALYEMDEGYRRFVEREEIIRCRDCKHYRTTPYHDGTERMMCSGVFQFVEAKPNSFCAWAERDA